MPGGSVDAGDPQLAQVALAVAAVAVGVLQSPDYPLLGKAEAPGAIVLHSFGSSQHLGMASVGGCSSFDAHMLDS